MTDHSLLKCCGNCARFAHEEADGYGWCLSASQETRCSSVCDFHEWDEDDDDLVNPA